MIFWNIFIKSLRKINFLPLQQFRANDWAYIYNFTKQTFSILTTNGYKIQTCLWIIISA